MAQKKRPILITGNWKMYKTIEEGKQFLATLAPQIKMSQVSSELLRRNLGISLAVPSTAIYALNAFVKELEIPISIGAQNMGAEKEGAFTGEISARMLKEAGADFVLLGHSERRRYFFETNELINKKIPLALSEDLMPVLCIGESLEEREQGKTEMVLKDQLMHCLDNLSIDMISQITLAYEPLWAIGTGRVATPEEAETVHAFCRKIISVRWGEKLADALVIQYGGSVHPDNSKALLSQKDIDGLLIGGSSLSADLFSKIIHSYGMSL